MKKEKNKPEKKNSKKKNIEEKDPDLEINSKKKELKLKKEKKKKKTTIVIGLILSLIIGGISFFFSRNITTSIISLVISFALIEVYIYFRGLMKKSARIRKMDQAFPDLIELMASNLRAGMTIDRALLLSSRKEFDPLDKEILRVGKDIVTGKEITQALLDMAERTKSEKILKTVTIINTGIISGGNLAVLLEQTAINMRERNFVEKKAASNVLMYLIFIFFAVAIGSPALFGLSSVLVEVLTNILGNIPEIDTGASNLPFTLTSVNISITFIIYFSMVFLIMTNILASMLLGLVSKGEEKAGIKYTVPLVTLGIAVFFIVRVVILSRFSSLLS